MMRRVVQCGAAITLLAGVVLQFLQQTDPVFPLLYFTVDSALLEAVILLSLLRRPRAEHTGVEITAVAGVLLSALVYTTVIAPSSPSATWFNDGDDLRVRIATILLHGVAPILIMAEYLTRTQDRKPTVRHAFILLWWPTAYLVVVGAFDAVDLCTVPYPFLQPSESGHFAVLAAVLVIGLINVLLGLMLVAGRRRSRPHRMTAPMAHAPQGQKFLDDQVSEGSQ